MLRLEMAYSDLSKLTKTYVFVTKKYSDVKTKHRCIFLLVKLNIHN